MNQKQLEAFRLVMKTGSISMAAQQLYVSQPTVSRLLSDLEKSTGLKLFDRRQGKTDVRPEALAFYESVEKVFLGANYLRRVAEEIRNDIGVRLRVGCFPAFGLCVMPEIVAEFHREFPKASFELTVATSPSLGDAVASGTTDITVVGGTPNLVGTEIMQQFNAPCVCVVKADDPLAKCDVIDLQGFDKRNVIWLNSHSNVESTLRRSMPVNAAQSGGSLYVNLADTACRLVMLGIGIAVIDPVTALTLPVPNLVVRPIKPLIGFEFSILRSEKLVLSNVAKSFLSRVSARCEAIEQQPVRRDAA
jgi:DNA-binding transcriptional LysR family regulator